MSYIRLTNNNHDEYDPEYDFCIDCKYFGEPSGCNRPNGTCNSYDRFLETYNRLTELEDKIENGALIFIDEPFYSECNDCWAVFQRKNNNVITCYMTEQQARDYKKH